MGPVFGMEEELVAGGGKRGAGAGEEAKHPRP